MAITNNGNYEKFESDYEEYLYDFIKNASDKELKYAGFEEIIKND